MTQLTHLLKGCTLVLVCLFSLSTPELFAQFNPSSGTEFAYPTAIMNGRTEHSSCYKAGNMVLAAWDEPNMGGQVMWQVLNSSNLPVCQGTLNYPPGTRDIEVGLLQGSGGTFVAFIAYHSAGVGHQLEQWLWDPSACTFTSMGPTISLSTAAYGRISMDSHKFYGLVIAWDEYSVLKSVLYLSMGGAITNSIIHTVPTPMVKISEPDVAFSHPNSGLNMNYVYLEAPASGAGGPPVSARVRQASFWTEYSSTTLNMTAPLMDVNPLSGTATHRVICNIDAPDHNWDTWAYAYTDDMMDVSVRIFNGGGSTVTMTNASLPGMSTPINSDPNTRPTLSYSPLGDEIMVGWHTLFNYPTESYVAAQMMFDGSALTSAPDFLEIPIIPSMASGAPTLAFAKMNENTGNYLYAFFSEFNNSTGYDMKHKFHNWASVGSFKKEQHHCEDEDHLHELASMLPAQNHVHIYPNPSSDFFSLSSGTPISGESRLVVTDLSGKQLYQTRGNWAYINGQLRNFSQNLEAGTYLIQVVAPDQEIDQTVKVQKL